MANKNMIKVMIKERLTEAAEEIFALFEQSIAEYQREIDRLKHVSESKRLKHFTNPQFTLEATQATPMGQMGEEDVSLFRCKEETEKLMITEEDETQIVIGDIKTEVKGEEFQPNGLQLNTNRAESKVSGEAETDRSFELTSESEKDDSDSGSDEYPFGTRETKKPFGCSICKKRFGQQRGLRMHMKWAHESEKPMTSAECRLQMDSERHSYPDRPFSCTVCKRQFKLKCTLDAHTREHTWSNPYHCSACVASFANNTDFICHINTVHSTENPFKCSICNRSLKSLRSYQSHMRLHTGDRPFRCSVCGRGFLQKGNLTYHMLTHSGEKPFSCSECGARYTSKQNLMHHKNVNH